MRRKTRKKLILIALLVAAVPLALKGLMYLRVKMAVDGFIADLADRATIDYRKIETGFSGAANILGVRVQSHDLGAAIEIQRIRVATDDVWYFLDPRPLFGESIRQRPDQMRLQAIGITVPLNDRVIAALQPPGVPAGPASSCDEISFGPAMLKALGMQRLEADMEAAYRFDRDRERLALDSRIDVHGVETIQLALELAGIVPEDLELGRAGKAKLASAEAAVDIQPEFGKRFLAHCAAKQQQNLDAYVTGMIERSHQRLTAEGIELGPVLQKALDDYNRQWGRLVLRLRPPEPLAMLQLISVAPDRMVSALGMSLTINGHPVSPLDVRINPRQLETELPTAPNSTSTTAAGDAPRRYLIRRQFVSTSVDALQQLLGRRVRITQRGEPVREGILVAVVGGEALVEQREPKGKVVAYVPIKEISAVQVQKVERIPQP